MICNTCIFYKVELINSPTGLPINAVRVCRHAFFALPPVENRTACKLHATSHEDFVAQHIKALSKVKERGEIYHDEIALKRAAILAAWGEP